MSLARFRSSAQPGMADDEPSLSNRLRCCRRQSTSTASNTASSGVEWHYRVGQHKTRRALDIHPA